MSDLAIIAADPTALDSYADPDEFIMLACTQAKGWLVQAIGRGDLAGLVDFKSQAKAVETYSTQKRLGEETQLMAQEIVRRAEFSIGAAIRHGQEVGTIKRHGYQPPAQSDVADGNITPVSPTQYVPPTHERVAIYAMADAGEETFEKAIEEGRAERDLSRANVHRKVTGKPAPTGARHEIHRKKRHLDPNRMMAGFVDALDAAATAAGLFAAAGVSVYDLDSDQLAGWSESIEDSLRSIHKFKKEITRANIIAD